MITNLVYFALACITLTISGIYLVKSLSKIARFLGISEFSAAFIIMAFATSIPELFVGISSALSKVPELSLGNIIGANIIDLTLISGIIIILSKEIKIKTQKIGNDVYFMLIALLLVIVLYSLGQSLSRVDGLILLGFFIINSIRVLKKRKRYTKKIKDKEEKRRELSWLLIFIFALIGLFISSAFAVKYGSNLAIDLHLPKIMIGLLVLSIATTLPELVFGISAINLKHNIMAIGDQTGTILTNSTLILGIVSIISPITAEFFPFLIASIFMIISGFIFIMFLKTGRKLERIEGISLILIYILFITMEFFIK